MNILVLGGDGYLGWATAMHLYARGYNITVVDNPDKMAKKIDKAISKMTSKWDKMKKKAAKG